MSLPRLQAGDFPAFFRTLWGYDPFPWQTRLAEEVAAQGRWPDLLDLPTGSGKTAAIDVAVFHLALEADKGEARRAAMRVAFVVDRRLIVDEAHARAMRLARALKEAARNVEAPEVVKAVAQRLRHLAGEGQPPLVVRSMRGGAPREDDWARTPCQPTVLCSTVDQVGSRLLFRGYGVSDSMKPVQAGLVGSDALILLDEAHLSEPFRQTVRDISALPALHGADRARVRVALLTATAGLADPPSLSDGEEESRWWPFGLTEEDRQTDVLERRLEASKPARVTEVGDKDDQRAEGLAKRALELMETLRNGGVTAPAIGIIANRVARARAAFDRLTGELGEAAELVLVIGRARGVDREAVAKKLSPIKTGIKPRPAKPFVVVATQTLEAGVDIDLDGLVTDAASLDALRQRFGRVNRDGREIPACGMILADKADRKAKKDGDPIYGEAITKTLEALFPGGVETIDFGISALEAELTRRDLIGPALRSLLTDKTDAPVLMPAYVDLWTRTSPRPSADPEPSLFLHGPKREPASVQLVWRADLDLGLGDEKLRELLSLAPPRAPEAIELPVWAVGRWLQGEGHIDLGDVDQAEAVEREAASLQRAVFRWRGADDDGSRIVWPREIRAGDMVVVPSGYGGCDAHGWKPGDGSWVADVYEKAAEPHDGKRFVVRIHPGLIRQAVFDEAERDEKGPAESDEARWERLEAKASRVASEVRAALRDSAASSRSVAEALLATGLPEPLRRRLNVLVQRARRPKQRGRPTIDPPAYPYRGEEGDRAGVVLVAPFGVTPEPGERREGGGEASGANTEDDEAGSFIGVAQPLDQHSHEVEETVRSFGRRAGLAENLIADLALAAWLHDAGKADLRFQRLLYGGDLLAMEAGGVLAKSARGRSPPGATERAGLPPHWRHEALSVRLALENPRLRDAHDRGLVLWLVGTHHGHGRPFFPHEDAADQDGRELAVVDGLSSGAIGAGAGPQSMAFIIEGQAFSPNERDPADLRGLDWPTLFRDLKRRYGPWGLARLEAVLRLADHRASEALHERAALDAECGA